MTEAETSAFSPVKSAERTVALLETLAASPHRMTVGEIQRATGYPRSSLHALLRTLRGLRWVEADESGTSFGIGPSALLTGTAYLDRYEALPAAARTLEELRERLGAPCTSRAASSATCSTSPPARASTGAAAHRASDASSPPTPRRWASACSRS